MFSGLWRRRLVVWAIMVVLFSAVAPNTFAKAAMAKPGTDDLLWVTSDSAITDSVKVSKAHSIKATTTSTAEGILLDANLLNAADSGDLDIIKKHLGQGKAVFVVGSQVFPNQLVEKAGLALKNRYQVGDQVQLVLDGVVMVRGRLHSSHVVTSRDATITASELADLARDEIKMAKMSRPAAPPNVDDVSIQSCSSWITEGSNSHTWYQSSWGRYYQSWAGFSLDAACDGDPNNSYWQLELQNTSTYVSSGKGWKQAATKIAPSSGSINSYGPPGSTYSSDSTVSWSLSWPYPTVGYSFGTGDTSLTNQSNPVSMIQHRVDIPAQAPESTGTYTWTQSLRTTAGNTATGQLFWVYNYYEFYPTGAFNNDSWSISFVK